MHKLDVENVRIIFLLTRLRLPTNDDDKHHLLAPSGSALQTYKSLPVATTTMMMMVTLAHVDLTWHTEMKSPHFICVHIDQNQCDDSEVWWQSEEWVAIQYTN